VASEHGAARMSLDTIVSGALAFLIVVYLVYTLLRPEKF
jgi:K+-transporting ATPase KdpF subunit